MRNNNKGVLVSVPLHISGYAGIKYAFKCRAGEGNLEILGATLIEAALTNATGYILGCNSPKPPRATKKTNTGSISSFCDSAKATELKAEKWVITRGKAPRKGVATAYSQSYYIEIDGTKYAFTSSKSASPPAGLAELGLLPVEAATTGLVWGCTFPKPARATIQLANGSHYSTFASPALAAEAVPVGWGITLGKAQYTAADLTSHV